MAKGPAGDVAIQRQLRLAIQRYAQQTRGHQAAVARHLGHSSAWLSQVLRHGSRRFNVKDALRVAHWMGLAIHDGKDTFYVTDQNPADRMTDERGSVIAQLVAQEVPRMTEDQRWLLAQVAVCTEQQARILRPIVARELGGMLMARESETKEGGA